MTRKALILLILPLLPAAVFAQSKREWLVYGDEAFRNGDYSSAVEFYLKVLDESTLDLESTVYPYEIKAYIRPDRQKKKAGKTDEAATSDSARAMTDSLAMPSDTAAKPAKQQPTGQDPAPKLIYGKYQHVVHQIADSYRLSYKYGKAEEWYARALLNESKRHPFARYWYAMILMNNEKYPEASAQLETFIETYDGPDAEIKKKAQRKLFNAVFGSDSSNYRDDASARLLDSVINSGTSSFAANYYGDTATILFSSGRPGNIILDDRVQNPMYISDLYLTSKTESGWRPPKNMRRPVNTELDEGAGVLSVDKTHFYFTRCENTGTPKEECAIYLTRFLNGQWLQPMKLNNNVNREGYSSKHPALSPDETLLYFSSNRPGTLGKMDLWYCTIDEFGNAGDSYNLGYDVNTPENEVTPHFQLLNNTLYFSSDGHTGFGGYDIFRTNGKDSTWIRPRNMGAPVNSGKDDLYLVLERQEGRKGFLTSDRDSCVHCSGPEGNYCYRIYEVEVSPVVITVSGIVYDKETGKIMPNTLVQINDVKEEVPPAFLITDEKGYYSTTLVEEVMYFLKAQKAKYFADAASISTVDVHESKDIVQDFYLKPIPQGDIEIPGIEYDYDKATLRPKSKEILDNLYDFLELNNNIVIEIGSHTDERGSDAYNERLSEERAKSVVDYLTGEKGLPKDRLAWKGYGETKLLIPHAKNEEEHQRNRRTAFQVLSQDYRPRK